MPFGGLLSAGIGAGSSLISGLFGSKAAKNAAQQQQQNAAKVADLTGKAVTAGQDQIAGGIAGVKDATTQGQAGVAAGVSGANSTLDDAIAKQLDLYKPYIGAGADSISSIQDLAGAGGPLTNKFSFNPEDLSKDPGYAFALSEGQKALQRSAAAKGSLFSGGTLKSLAGYTEGTANQYFNDAFSRAKTTFDTNQNTALSRISTLQQLANLGFGGASNSSTAIGTNAGQKSSNTLGGAEFGAQIGQTGAGQVLGGEQSSAGLGLQGAQIIGNAMTGGANAGAAGTVGSTNSWINALNNGNTAIQDYLAKNSATGYNPYPVSLPGTQITNPLYTNYGKP